MSCAGDMWDSSHKLVIGRLRPNSADRWGQLGQRLQMLVASAQRVCWANRPPVFHGGRSCAACEADDAGCIGAAALFLALHLGDRCSNKPAVAAANLLVSPYIYMNFVRGSQNMKSGLSRQSDSTADSVSWGSSLQEGAQRQGVQASQFGLQIRTAAESQPPRRYFVALRAIFSVLIS